MIEERTPLAFLKGKTIATVTIEPHGRYYNFHDETGVVICSIDREHLYDGNGNYFDEDATP